MKDPKIIVADRLFKPLYKRYTNETRAIITLELK